MYYDLILHNGQLHICNSPASFSEEEVLDAFDLQGGVFIYGSDYAEDVQQVKDDLLNESETTDYDDDDFWSELVVKYQMAMEMSDDNE